MNLYALTEASKHTKQVLCESQRGTDKSTVIGKDFQLT